MLRCCEPAVLASRPCDGRARRSPRPPRGWRRIRFLDRRGESPRSGRSARMLGYADPMADRSIRLRSARLPGASTPRSENPSSAAVSAHCCLIDDLDRQPFLGSGVTPPVAQQERRIVEVGDHRAVRAAVGKAGHGALVHEHLVHRMQVALAIVRDRYVDEPLRPPARRRRAR